MKKWIISIIVVLASLGILCGCGTNVPKGWDTYQLGDKIEYSFAPDWEIIGYGNGESDTAAGFEWMDGEECFHLLLQSLTDEVALGTEVDAAWCVLRDLKQPVLDAEDGILQTEIEGGALLGGHVPDRFSLGNCHRQP